VNRLASVSYNLLIRTVRLADRIHMYWLWEQLWMKSVGRWRCSVFTRLHGYRSLVNFGNPYPIFARRFPRYNSPLVELVFQAFTANESPICFVDVGAGVGDSVMLVQRSCPQMIKTFHCVEGDPEFFGYLQANLRRFSGGHLSNAVLSSSQGTASALVRVHAGTSSAQGAERVPATTLDLLLDSSGARGVHLLKTDVDGYDGRVLVGSMQMLRHERPVVLFEWHPLLCVRTGSGWLDHFEALVDCGYSTFVWFNKFGEFSHLDNDFDRKRTQILADSCFARGTDTDWHYDVVALHHASKITPLSVAELAFADRRKSRF